MFLGCAFNTAHSQPVTITQGDGSPLITQYCHQDNNFEIAGLPAGGTFNGCGVFQQSGSYFFNPVTATAGVTVFPVNCVLSYTVNGTMVTRNILIWKPVVITPPLEDSFTCNGDFYLHATTLYAGDYDYEWTPGGYLELPDSPATTGFINTTQTFVLNATDVTSGCMGSDTVTISRAPLPEITVSNDTIVFARQQISLFAEGAQTYQWSPSAWLNDASIATPLARPQASITYTVTGTNEYGCTDMDSVIITVLEGMLIPNAFSPNGDGINDEFRIANFGYQEVKEFLIFNRWGQIIFQTRDGTKGWDGTQNNIPVETGSYCYSIKLKLADETIKVFKGDIALIR